MNTNTGYSKKTLGDSYVLLSGGGHKTLSEFIGTLSYSNNKITYTKANDSTSYDLVTIPTVPEYDLYVGASNGTSTAALSTNGNVHLILKKGSNYTRYKIKGYTNISVTSTADEIKITGPNLSGYLTSVDLSGYLTSLYTTGLYVGATETQENSQTSNGNTYIKLFDDSTRRANIKISGSTNVSVSSNSSGDITITGPDLSGYLNDGSLYVLKAGDTMTGVLHLMSSQYVDSYDSGALDLNNSDIYKVNSIKFADLSDTAAEGLQWYRDSTHVDSIWVKNGVIYFTPNRAWNGTGTNYTVYHTGNLPAYPTKASWNYDDVYLKLTGGTLYNTSSDTPLNIKSNGNNAYIAFQKSDGTSIGSIGVKNDNRAYFYDGSSTHKLAYYSEIPSDYLTTSDLSNYLTSSDLKTYSAVLTDTNAKTTNVTGGLFYNLLEKTGDGSYSVIKSVKFVGDGTGISVSSDANGVITITNSKPDLNHNVTTSLYLGGSGSTSDVALTTNGNSYLILKEGSSYTRKQIKGYSNISVTNTTSEIKITGPDLSGFLTSSDLEGINTHYTTGLYIGATEAKSNALTTNGNTYIKLFDDDSRRANIKISGSTNVSVASDSSGNITITGPNLSGYLTDLPEHSHDRLTCQGAMNPESGRTAARGGVYSYITNASYNTGAPTTYTSVIGFGKGTSGHGEIAVRCTNGTSTYTDGMWYRSLRDYQDDWYGWTKVCDDHNTYISSGTITINGTSITPLTSHQSLSNYVLKSGDTMTGNLIMNSGTTTEPSIKFVTNRDVSNGSGWAFSPIKINGNNDSSIFNISIFGTQQSFQYAYFGNNAYDSWSNIRMYPSGNIYSKQYLLKDNTGFLYPAAYDNGTNLWIGATQTTTQHHKGQTFISSGYNGTSGNSTIKVSVPNATNTDASNYDVLHSGNWSTYIKAFVYYPLNSSSNTDFNFPDGHDCPGGLYYLNNSSMVGTQTNRPVSFGMLLNFECQAGHLQLASTSSLNDLRFRSYWWTNNNQSSGFPGYPDWTTILHSGNTYISNGTITINGSSITPMSVDVDFMQHHTTANDYNSTSGLRIIKVSNDSTLAGSGKYGSIIQWCNYDASAPGTSNNKSWYNQLIGLTDDNLYFRTRLNGENWTSTKRLAFASEIPDVSKYAYIGFGGTSLASNTDLNTILTAGTYYASSGTVSTTFSNRPSISGNVKLWHICNTGTDGGAQQWATQVLMETNKGKFYSRSYENGTFGAWHTAILDNPGAVEQTIQSSIGSLDKGVINLWRSNGNYYTFLGFSNSSSNTYLGGIGFTAQGNTTIYYRNTSGSVFPLLHPDSNGNLTITGSYYANSDIKLKNILSRESYSSNYFATLPIIKFTWNNRNDSRVHLGTIALDVEFDFPELVTKDENGYKSLDYATLGTIGVISLAKEIVELRKEINELKLKLYDNNLYN